MSIVLRLKNPALKNNLQIINLAFSSSSTLHLQPPGVFILVPLHHFTPVGLCLYISLLTGIFFLYLVLSLKNNNRGQLGGDCSDTGKNNCLGQGSCVSDSQILDNSETEETEFGDNFCVECREGKTSRMMPLVNNWKEGVAIICEGETGEGHTGSYQF